MLIDQMPVTTLSESSGERNKGSFSTLGTSSKGQWDFRLQPLRFSADGTILSDREPGEVEQPAPAQHPLRMLHHKGEVHGAFRIEHTEARKTRFFLESNKIL
ncbi:hypothetical protein M758_9G170800 [Ceratodon purpureus]|nr:hypothetical protein M758_9G170800 [Ceratodon purpureus]